MNPETRYADSGGVQIAYQVVGDGPVDVVLVPAWLSNIDIGWDMPPVARFVERLASFARVILFDRRGNGMSDGLAGETPLEGQVDDVLAVIDAVSSEHPALIAFNEGCALAALFAASHPERVQSIVLLTPMARLVRGPGYEWAQTPEERAVMIDGLIAEWATDRDWSAFSNAENDSHSDFARFRRLAMSPPRARAALEMLGDTDVRGVLPSIQCPTLVLRHKDDDAFDERHSSYIAERIPNARYLQLAGTGPVWASEERTGIDEIEHFLTGARRTVVSDRVLATVLFTDIVGSTERAAELGDGAWRTLLGRHDSLVREHVERHRGRFIKSLGDGALATFDGPSRAISSAIAIRDGVRELGVEIRGGLHTGECELLPEGDVGGLAVHIGARISGLAGPGELLASSTVRDLVVGSGQELHDRGEHDLKGVPGPWRVFSVQT